MKAPFLTVLMALLVFASCSKYQKVVNGDDIQAKVAMADSLYKKKDYDRAKALYNEAKNVFLAGEDQRRVLLHLAYCEYHTKEKFLASYHFNRFYESFPYSAQAEEALFMKAMCDYEASPKISLDQRSSTKAIAAFQLFASKYPTSERVAECNTKIDELRDKIEFKEYKNAKLWHQIMDYKSAVWALNNFVDDFPGSSYREEAEFLILESSYKLAELSIESKKEERYNQALEYYNSFRESYPKSSYLNEAKKIGILAQEKSKRIKQ